MSLITCCPACGTMFKVVADQLKISDGWVRCGHCAQVFDAPAHMVGGEPVAAPAATSSPPPAAARVAAPTVSPVPARPAPLPPTSRVAEPAAPVAADTDLEPPPSRPFVTEAAPDEVPVAAGIEVEEIPVFGPEELRRAQVETAQADEPVQEVSFIRDARRRAFWTRPLVRFVLVLVLLALAGVLAVQVAVQERDRLAASEPALKPLLTQLCAYLQCSVGPARQIESVAIDSSSFSKLRPDTYRLSFTLKNAAAMPIAVPAMELTLTDTQEQAVVRRVLTPADLGAAPVLPASGEWAASVTLSVAPTAGNGRISGYRLLAFYP
ncbi:DUF3426 domain-containing protein [Ramlibacter albus]|uniref:DUF3426 domain-containing protein n=1 Tax=Ramlibacter albus TaxID=2079448 RepID=A0A923S2J1_9BURK|nr:DUF3426 domain-containing protein [Ramlibacter albus]MBC5765529.1 DUF3426 domain-containing protein [Ramlibacter albus]